MTELEARRVLGLVVQSDNKLRWNGELFGYIDWDGCTTVVIDGIYDSEFLTAVAWWITNMKVLEPKP